MASLSGCIFKHLCQELINNWKGSIRIDGTLLLRLIRFYFSTFLSSYRLILNMKIKLPPLILIYFTLESLFSSFGTTCVIQWYWCSSRQRALLGNLPRKAISACRAWRLVLDRGTGRVIPRPLRPGEDWSGSRVGCDRNDISSMERWLGFTTPLWKGFRPCATRASLSARDCV